MPARKLEYLRLSEPFNSISCLLYNMLKASPKGNMSHFTAAESDGEKRMTNIFLNLKKNPSFHFSRVTQSPCTTLQLFSPHSDRNNGAAAVPMPKLE